MSVRSLPKSIKLNAIVHMIGQMEAMLQPVTTATVAAFIGCTKPTAKTYLDECVRRGYLECHPEHWRGSAVVFHWRTTERARTRFPNNLFRIAYQTLLSAKGIIL